MNELQRLRDRIEELEEMIGVDATHVDKLRCLGLTKIEARTIGFFMKRDIVSRDALYTAIYGGLPESDQPGSNTLSVLICKCRAKLKVHGIKLQTVWGTGWMISPEAKKIIEGQIDATFGKRGELV